MDSKILKPATSREEYQLYKAALEWALIDPIVIENKEDIKSSYLWSGLVEPYDHQVKNLITFCRRLPVTLLADDVGLGKTISAGLIISELISRGRLEKILIICPKILREQWQEELKEKFNIPSIIVTGSEFISAEPPKEGGAVITTYNTARLHLDKIEKTGYEMLILDEAHKLRNLYGTDEPPQVAVRFRKALSNRLFKYVLMLTATPIQTRLWDVYSLIDLLTVARGHENPFGSEGLFSRNFIADERSRARHLRPEAREKFRSIVYGYMSRVRRGDANLHFPERIVQLHTVTPSDEELLLISTVSKHILSLNHLSQIVILQALVSSPEALVKLLEGMQRRGTASSEFTEDIKKIVKKITITRKLQCLSILIDQLRLEKPENWRVVIFTRWRETQTSIQLFLETQGVTCGIINGDSASKNQETIRLFRKDSPEVNVIISTEAGSEGINLQMANVMVNYDLPWNPMIVEQRIGRIQRLSSDFAKVSIFNIVLKDTFEEHIVAVLLEKLQMASSAIGDIEALLEASGLDNGDEDSASSFEELIRRLVVSSLEGKNVLEATRKAEESIGSAKIKLEEEQRSINELLGKMDELSDLGPQCPKLPQIERSMEIVPFVEEALLKTNTKLEGEIASYRPGIPAFERLVDKISRLDLHSVIDIDNDPLQSSIEQAKKWVASIGGQYKNTDLTAVYRVFEGIALVRAKASVACDSYERLVTIKCEEKRHQSETDKSGILPTQPIIDNLKTIGVDVNLLSVEAANDDGILKFCDFYKARLAVELSAAGADARKRKKIEDDFTPRLHMLVVGLEGAVHRTLAQKVTYTLDSNYLYNTIVRVIPSRGILAELPEMGECQISNKIVPKECLDICEITRHSVLKEHLTISELSSRKALFEFGVTCSLSKKKVLIDEVDKSDITGNHVIRDLLKKSAVSGRKGEPEYFTQCQFTNTCILKNEAAVSQVSNKQYRADEQQKSVVSGKTGHSSEFILCAVTNNPLLPLESETCQITNKIVIPGLLEKCDVSGLMVLPPQLERSVVSNKKALKKFFVQSDLSGAFLLENEAIKSISGKYCLPLESKTCMWSNERCHPTDIRECQLTGFSVHIKYITSETKPYLEPLNNLLNGIQRKADKQELWGEIEQISPSMLNTKHCKVETAVLSPDQKRLATCIEVRTWVGLKIRYAGFIYSIDDKLIVSKIEIGKREAKGWIQS